MSETDQSTPGPAPAPPTSPPPGPVTGDEERWQRDLAIAQQDEFVKVTDKMLNNPFGTQRGAIAAWQKVREQAIGEGVMP